MKNDNYFSPDNDHNLLYIWILVLTGSCDVNTKGITTQHQIEAVIHDSSKMRETPDTPTSTTRYNSSFWNPSEEADTVSSETET